MERRQLCADSCTLWLCIDAARGVLFRGDQQRFSLALRAESDPAARVSRRCVLRDAEQLHHDCLADAQGDHYRGQCRAGFFYRESGEPNRGIRGIGLSCEECRSGATARTAAGDDRADAHSLAANVLHRRRSRHVHPLLHAQRSDLGVRVFIRRVSLCRQDRSGLCDDRHRVFCQRIHRHLAFRDEYARVAGGEAPLLRGGVPESSGRIRAFRVTRALLDLLRRQRQPRNGRFQLHRLCPFLLPEAFPDRGHRVEINAEASSAGLRRFARFVSSTAKPLLGRSATQRVAACDRWRAVALSA